MTTRELIQSVKTKLSQLGVEIPVVFARIELLGGPYDGLFLYLPEADQEHSLAGYLYAKTGVGINGEHVFSYQGKDNGGSREGVGRDYRSYDGS